MHYYFRFHEHKHISIRILSQPFSMKTSVKTSIIFWPKFWFSNTNSSRIFIGVIIRVISFCICNRYTFTYIFKSWVYLTNMCPSVFFWQCFFIHIKLPIIYRNIISASHTCQILHILSGDFQFCHNYKFISIVFVWVMIVLQKLP